ncbi:MAG TPA: hypothetical protein VK540_26845 [Polyangiaceae bacterium]|nr:hypothetical protein [Polyangiaceae bacterium]
MSRHLAAARESMVPSWDAPRQRRVLERAVLARSRRSRLWRALAWSSAAATAVVLVRIVPSGIGHFNTEPSGAPLVQPGRTDPSTANPPPSFTDGGDREG